MTLQISFLLLCQLSQKTSELLISICNHIVDKIDHSFLVVHFHIILIFKQYLFRVKKNLSLNFPVFHPVQWIAVCQFHPWYFLNKSGSARLIHSWWLENLLRINTRNARALNLPVKIRVQALKQQFKFPPFAISMTVSITGLELDFVNYYLLDN